MSTHIEFVHSRIHVKKAILLKTITSPQCTALYLHQEPGREEHSDCDKGLEGLRDEPEADGRVEQRQHKEGHSARGAEQEQELEDGRDGRHDQGPA